MQENFLDVNSSYHIRKEKPYDLYAVLSSLQKYIDDFEKLGIEELNYLLKNAKSVYELGCGVLKERKNKMLEENKK